MENIVRLSPQLILELAVVTTECDHKGHSLRVCTGTDATGAWLKYDAGHGWTPPLYGVEL
jgi:hypothetical protein